MLLSLARCTGKVRWIDVCGYNSKRYTSVSRCMYCTVGVDCSFAVLSLFLFWFVVLFMLGSANNMLSNHLNLPAECLQDISLEQVASCDYYPLENQVKFVIHCIAMDNSPVTTSTNGTSKLVSKKHYAKHRPTLRAVPIHIIVVDKHTCNKNTRVRTLGGSCRFVVCIIFRRCSVVNGASVSRVLCVFCLVLTVRSRSSLPDINEVFQEFLVSLEVRTTNTRP